MESKRLSLRRHAQRRAKERYGLLINKRERREIIGMIREEKASFIQRHSLRVSEFSVSYMGRDVRVLYDKKRHELITFLPPQ
jgi:hypothetical protein